MFKSASIDTVLGAIVTRSSNISEALERASVLLREPDNRAAVSQTTVNTICHMYYEADIELQVLCLKVLCNAVADYDPNREFLLENTDVVRQVIADLGADSRPVEFVNYAMATLFNLSNGYKPAEKFLKGEQSLAKTLVTLVSRQSSNPGFLLFVAMGLLHLYLDDADKLFTVATLDIFLELSTELLEEDPETEDVEPVEFLLQIIEKSELIQKEVATSRAKLKLLLGLVVQLNAHRLAKGLGMHILSALASVSSHDEFSTLVSVTPDNEILRELLRFVTDNNSSQNLYTAGLIVLANLATSDDKVRYIVNQRPHMIECVMQKYSAMTSPFELQSAHFIKNVSVVKEYKPVILDNGARELIQKLIEVKLFAPIRQIGVQLARNLFPARVDLDILNDLLEVSRAEDTEAVKRDLLIAFSTALEKYTGNVAEPISETFAVLIRSIVEIIDKNDTWDSGLLVKITKSLGVVSTRTHLLELFTANGDASKKLLTLSAKLGEAEGPSLIKSVNHNIAYIAANLKTHNLFVDESTIAIRNA
ncbi:hypothetical protein TRVA0_066S00210 [Trichomonascus vanleenenianus]|uniref:uncharacterized protein n=1 Tax=Trichomonascus vanleenenianus TaxID=2268995 RepID=UPI003EC9EA76